MAGSSERQSPKMHQLDSPLVHIEVKEEGAELTSLYSRISNRQYLWQADPGYWGRHAPVLFPIVGKLKNNSYTWKGRTYNLPQHGFARDEKFRLIEKTDKQLTFLLTENERTLQNYPFPFKLFIIYKLEEDKVRVTYSVDNAGEEQMYFSIGAHPAFNCPLKPDENYSDYYLEFEVPEIAERLFIEEGFLSEKRELILNNNNKLPISHEMFKDDALIFSGLRSTCLSLKSKNHKNGVKLCFSGFPYLGIWAKPDADFVCIEPWYGITDTLKSSGKLEEKLGIIKLEPQESFSCSYYIQVF